MGRRLLDKMERTAAIAKCEAITLKISSAAEDAIKFHIRHGYHVVNTLSHIPVIFLTQIYLLYFRSPVTTLYSPSLTCFNPLS